MIQAAEQVEQCFLPEPEGPILRMPRGDFEIEFVQHLDAFLAFPEMRLTPVNRASISATVVLYFRPATSGASDVRTIVSPMLSPFTSRICGRSLAPDTSTAVFYNIVT